MPGKLTCLLLLLALAPAVFVHAGSICSEGYWTNELTGRPATGSVRVQLYKNMQLHVSGMFNGLSGLTSGVKLYGLSTAAAQSSFVTGAKAGFFDLRFNLKQASSFDPTFLFNSGNNATKAMILVADSIYTSLFSVTITTSQYPDGELTSSTQPCASNLCYFTDLSGEIAFPPNNSSGTAKAQLTINSYADARIQGEFSGLSGASTSLQIYIRHGSGGSAQVQALTSAQSTNTFPTGKFSGSFNVFFPLHDAANFDEGYLSSYSSNAMRATNAFIDALDNGMVYMAIQTTAYPQGEVAGYLQTCQ